MAFNDGKHVMLSYNHKSKAVVKAVHDTLISENIPVWFDDRDMEDNMYDSMAEAVNNASVVCCFMTPEYEKSKNCKLELEHGQTLGKRIIPCMISNRKVWKPSPSKWLALITGSVLAIDFSDTSEANILEKARELIDRITNQSSAPTTESIPSSVKLFEPIRQKYLRENKIKRIVNEEKSFPIEQSYINLAMVETKELQEKEKKLLIEQENKQDNRSKQHNEEILGTFEEIYRSKTSSDVESMFAKCKDQKKKVLILGRAGIGKSTFCQYVTYRWAKGEIWSEYDLVVLIWLRKLRESDYPSGKKYSPMDLVKEEYFPFDDLSNEEKQSFKEQCNTGKVLWILDGYDEFVQNIPKQLKGAFDYVLETQHHILTSRPYAITLSYNVKMEITGFTDDNIAEYVEQFFDQIKDEIPNAVLQGQKLLKFLKSTSSIWGIAHIPVNLELICSLWGDTDWSKNTTITMTMLYDNITEWLCRRHLQKQNINPEQQRKKWVYSRCDRELQFLETLAFNAMESNKIILPSALLENTEEETNCSLDDHPQLLNFGILKSYDDKPTGNQNQAEKQYYFIHLSFQEHFAARHLLKTLKGSDKQKATNFINNHKYDQRFQLVFIFASGLLAQSEYKPCEDAFWMTIEGEPLDLIGLKHIKLIIECVDELGDQTIFRQRVHFLKAICQWIGICVTAEASVIREHLLQSLQRTNSLLNKPLIQNELIKLMTTSDRVTKPSVFHFILQLAISEPTPEFLSTIHTALQDEDSAVQGTAIQALGKMGEKAATNEVIAALLNTLHDTVQEVRYAATEALGKVGEKAATNEVIAGLLTALRDEDCYVRTEASRALGKMGEKAATNEVITGLSNALQDYFSSVQIAASGALRKMGEKAVTNEVIAALLNTFHDTVQEVRYTAGEALGKMGEKAAPNEVIAGLMNALRDQNAVIRKEASEALRNMGQKAATNEVIADLLNTLRDQNAAVRYAASEALWMMAEKTAPNEVIPGLLNALRDEDSGVRYAASAAIGNMGEKAAISEVIASLLNSLRDEDSGVRKTASEAFGNMGEKAATNEAIAGLLNALRDEDSDVRIKASEALGKMGGKAVTNDVIAALFNTLHDTVQDVRYAASAALGNMGEKAVTNEVITGLFNALRDQNAAVRYAASEALGRMGQKAATNEVIAGLSNALRDEDSSVQRAATEVLGNMGEKAVTNEVIAGVLNALRDEDSGVRVKATEVLWKMGERAATNEAIAGLLNALRDENLGVRVKASEVLGKMGERAATNEVIAGLLNALRDENSGVRVKATEVLWKMGERAATNEVIAGLLNALRDEDSDVRIKASEALGKMGEKAATNEVIADLLNALRDQNAVVRREAIQALGKMGEKAATNDVMAGLLNTLHDKVQDVRYAASGALGNMGEKAVTNEVIAGLLNALRDQNAVVRRKASIALGNMGKTAGTAAVIVSLLSEFTGKTDSSMYADATNAFEGAMCSYRAMKELDSDMILQLYSCIRLCRNVKLRKVAPDQFIKVFLETRDGAWLPVIRFVALVQGIAFTVVGNNIVIHDVKQVLNLNVSRPELTETFVNGIKSQEKDLWGDCSSLTGIEDEMTH